MNLLNLVLVQSTQKRESKTSGNLAKVIAESVTSSFRFGSKTDLCPDRYDTEYCIELFEREKRATASSRERVIHNERTPLPPNFKEFFMNAKNKVSFISFVQNVLVEYLPSVLQSHQEMIVGRLDGSSWRICSHGKEQLPELFCDHKEADSRHASYCSSNRTVSRIVVFSSDTEVIVIACYHCNHLLQTCSEVCIRTSHGKKSQFILIHRIYTTLGEKICRVLPSFHCLTSCDSTEIFSGT